MRIKNWFMEQEFTRDERYAISVTNQYEVLKESEKAIGQLTNIFYQKKKFAELLAKLKKLYWQILVLLKSGCPKKA